MAYLAETIALVRDQDHVRVCRQEPPVPRIRPSHCRVSADRLDKREVRPTLESLVMKCGRDSEDPESRQAQISEGIG